MYQIKKFADCWAVFNLCSEISRILTSDEVSQVCKAIPTLSDSQTASYFTDDIKCLQDLP